MLPQRETVVDGGQYEAQDISQGFKVDQKPAWSLIKSEKWQNPFKAILLTFEKYFFHISLFAPDDHKMIVNQCGQPS